MAIKKLLELRGEDWMGGISIHPTLPLGGIFRSATNFDPFEKMGYMVPSRAPVRYGTATATTQIQYFANFTDNNLPYMYGYAGATAGGTTALYKILATDGTTTDVSAEISTSSSAARGCIVHKSKFVYAKDASIRANAIVVASGSDAAILSSGVNSAEHKFEVGADLNLYFTNGVSVGKIVDVTSTTGNTGNAFSLETGMTIRDIANDGRYLVIVADDRTGTDVLGVYNSVIAYWDYTSGVLTQRYDFQSGGLTGVQIMDGNAHVFGNDGMFVCNVASFPQLVIPFRGTANLTGTYPKLSSAIIKRDNAILWGDANSGKVFGYGSLIAGQKKIIFQITTAGGGNISALNNQGSTTSVSSFIWMGTTTPALYGQGISNTRDQAVVDVANIALPRTFKLSFIKVITTELLSSGLSITASILSQDQNKVVTQSTFSFAADGAKQSKMLYPESAAVVQFNEIARLRIDSTKAPIAAVEVWGEEVELQDQSL